MEAKVLLTQKKAGVALCMVLLVLLAQQVCAGPLGLLGPLGPQVGSKSQQHVELDGVQTLRRTARMSPLWRILNSKPHGAYCQNNYECSSGLCRSGHCSTGQYGSSETVNY